MPFVTGCDGCPFYWSDDWGSHCACPGWDPDPDSHVVVEAWINDDIPMGCPLLDSPGGVTVRVSFNADDTSEHECATCLHFHKWREQPPCNGCRVNHPYPDFPDVKPLRDLWVEGPHDHRT
jgi:hypothetical protein